MCPYLFIRKSRVYGFVAQGGLFCLSLLKSMIFISAGSEIAGILK